MEAREGDKAFKMVWNFALKDKQWWEWVWKLHLTSTFSKAGKCHSWQTQQKLAMANLQKTAYISHPLIHRPSTFRDMFKMCTTLLEKLQQKLKLYRSVGADGGEGVGSTGKQPVPVHQQHSDVVLALLLWKHTAVPLSLYCQAVPIDRKTKLRFTPRNGLNIFGHGRISADHCWARQRQIMTALHHNKGLVWGLVVLAD